MKCPMCSGKGMVDYPMYADDEHKWQYCVARMKKCDMCNGTGEVQMTNEEYLRSLNTEQLAEWIFQIFGEGVAFGETHGKTNLFPNDDIIHEGLVLEWLKQPHS